MVDQPIDPFYEKFGRRLRMARERRGLTQEVAAGLSGMAQPNLSRLEQGRQEVTLRIARDLAAIYQVPFDHLVMEDSPLDRDSRG